MIDARTAGLITDALHHLAEANWYEFRKSPALARAYRENLAAGRHQYVADKATCGLPDCWSTYRILVERYGGDSAILGDCEDFACAHAAHLANLGGPDRVYVGLIPGRHIAHAVAGIEDRRGIIQVLDPALWAGMKPTHYENPVWRQLYPKVK